MVPLGKDQCPDPLTDPAPFSRWFIAALPQGPAPQPFARPAALDPTPLLQVQGRVGVVKWDLLGEGVTPLDLSAGHTALYQ
jgi:hypothetical protein